MTDSSFALARAVGIWLTLVAVESIHGVMRRLSLAPQRGGLRARQVTVPRMREPEQNLPVERLLQCMSQPDREVLRRRVRSD